MHLGYIELEKVCISLIWNLKAVFNTLTADNKYSRCNVHNFAQQVQTPLSQKKKNFYYFLLHFWNVHEIWNILKKKMSILA